MNVSNLLSANQIRCELAKRLALQEWTGPKSYGTTCPFCDSSNYVKCSFEGGKQRFRCRNCKRRFNERPKFDCHCEVPGGTPSCLSCPGFQTFTQLLQKHAEGLRDKTVEEMQAMLESATNPIGYD